MTRRALGRGRLIVVLGAIVCLAGVVPPWWTLARTNAESLSGNGLESAGIIVFLAALAMLAVVTLPFATRDGDATLDRPAIYVLLASVAVVSFLLRLVEINGFGGLGLPMQAPGLWLTGIGLLVIVWGVADILTERPTTF